MSSATESIVLCEGYWDRAFWQGWLRSRGCKPLTGKPPQPGKGTHSWEVPSGRLLHVVPCLGRDKVKEMAWLHLKELPRRPLRQLVINLDPDGIGEQGVAAARDSVRGIVRQYDAQVRQTHEGDFEVGNGATLVSLVPWYVPDPVPPGVPQQQTLERLACAALCSAYGARGQAVQEWLARRPEPNPDKAHKAHAWSFMAGWYADSGCDNFYSGLWSDPPVAAELEKLLRETGAWRIAEALLS